MLNLIKGQLVLLPLPWVLWWICVCSMGFSKVEYITVFFFKPTCTALHWVLSGACGRIFVPANYLYIHLCATSRRRGSVRGYNVCLLYTTTFTVFSYIILEEDSLSSKTQGTMPNMPQLFTNATSCSWHHFWYDCPTTTNITTNTKTLGVVDAQGLRCEYP